MGKEMISEYLREEEMPCEGNVFSKEKHVWHMEKIRHYCTGIDPVFFATDYITYGPEYLMPEHLTRLKKRSLSRRRTHALMEFSLGMESLGRFVNKEPIFRLHECVFWVLAFEIEEVDPRL